MTTTSPTITEKIVMATRRQVYADARRLGLSPIIAAAQANQAAAFIHRIAGTIYGDWEQKFTDAINRLDRIIHPRGE